MTYKAIDRGLLEIIGPRGILGVLIKSTQKISNLQSGVVFNYALIMIVFTTLFLSGALGAWGFSSIRESAGFASLRLQVRFL